MKAHQAEIGEMTEGLESTIGHLEDNVNRHYKVITEVFSSIDQGIERMGSLQSLLLGSIEEGIGSILYYLFLLLGVFTLSLVSRSVRQNFVANIAWVLVSLAAERGLKALGLGEMASKARCGILIWIIVSNLLSLRKYESFEVRVIERIERLSGHLEERMRSARAKRVTERQEFVIRDRSASRRTETNGIIDTREDRRLRTC